MWRIIVALVFLTSICTSQSTDSCPNMSQKSHVEEFEYLLKSYFAQICRVRPVGVQITHTKEKTSTKVPKKVDKLMSLQRLFKWHARMKNIWTDFPVFEKEKRPLEDFLRLCDFTEANIGEGKIGFIGIPPSLIYPRNINQ